MSAEAMTREEALRHMKALPSWFDGYLYRSRTEARWAAFFKHLNIVAEPEPQGFLTGDSAYLPDFLLAGQAIIAEVKPSLDADPDGVQKLRNLIAARGKERGVVLPAIMPDGMNLLMIGPDGRGETWEDDRGTWLICPEGYHFDIQTVPERGCRDCGIKNGYWYDAEEIRGAYAFARNYRFGRQ